MTGRKLFSLLRPLITAIAALNRLLPRKLFDWTWFIVRDAPGHPGVFLRYIWVKRLAGACGDNVMIGRGCEIRGWPGLSFGRNVTLHLNSYIDASGGVTIGNEVSIAHGCSILSFEHTWADLSVPIKYNPLSHQAVEIQDDVWVGCGVRILAGSTVVSRSIVAAGAVVTRGTYGPGVFGGVPAKLIGRTV